jgi:hypothetical protein
MYCSLELVGWTHEGLIPVARVEDDDRGEGLLEPFKTAKGSTKEMGNNAVVSV